MPKSPNTRRVALVLICALLAVLGSVPAGAGAQVPAENEYDLAQLPNADGNNPSSTDSPAAGKGSSDSGGAPVLPIVLIGLAAVGAGVGVWRVRQNTLG
jgi:hypothetical protein